MFKHAKEKLLDQHLLSYPGIAPSYFIECLIYNAPNNLFVKDNYDSFSNVLNWLNQNKYRISEFKCPNGKHYLFNEGFIPFERQYVYKRWNTDDARKFINALVALWQYWGQ